MIPKQVAALLLCSALGAMAIPQPGQQPPPSTDTESSSSAPDAPICDSKWELIGRELKAHFIDSHGLCTDFARQCIRIPFHDCFPDGGCDGSLILSDECTTRKENRQMIPMCDVLGKIHREYNVGAADLINFAGSVANKACPYGPYIPFYTGRRDDPRPAPKGQLPPPTFTARQLIEVFSRKGFSPRELVALVGAHSAATNLTDAPFDTTPGKLDSCTYYTEVLLREAPAVLFSDNSLATSPETEPDWHVFAHSQELWDREYVEAMIKMITQGNDRRFLTDCSRVVHEIFM